MDYLKLFIMGCDAVSPEDGGSKVLQNTGILLQHYTASQTRRPWLESYPLFTIILTSHLMLQDLCSWHNLKLHQLLQSRLQKNAFSLITD